MVGASRRCARVEVFRLGRDGPAAYQGADPRSGRQSQVGGFHAGGLVSLEAAVPGTVREALTRLVPRSRRPGPLPDCLPFPRQQFVQPVLGQVIDPGQHIGEPRLRINIVHFGHLCRTPNYAESTFASRRRPEVESRRFGIV
jgi:hypothetical protein